MFDDEEADEVEADEEDPDEIGAGADTWLDLLDADAFRMSPLCA